MDSADDTQLLIVEFRIGAARFSRSTFSSALDGVVQQVAGRALHGPAPSL